MFFNLEEAAALAGSGNQGGESKATTEGFKVPEKFAGKSVEDVAKAYVELEKMSGTQAAKLKNLESYEKIGAPEQITEALNWARGVKAMIEDGRLSPAQAKQALKEGPQGSQQAFNSQNDEGSEPWSQEGWDFLTPAQQAKAMSSYVKGATQKEIKSYVDGLAKNYGDEIQNIGGNWKREQAILLKAITSALKTPGADINSLLQGAADLASKTPEELLDMALEAQSSPAKQQAEIARLVEERVAKITQDRDNDRMKALTGATRPSSRPKFGTGKTRQDEDRSLMDELKKKGIDLLG